MYYFVYLLSFIRTFSLDVLFIQMSFSFFSFFFFFLNEILTLLSNPNALETHKFTW